MRYCLQVMTQKNVSVYDPVTSETTTMAIADAQEYFEAYDCAFFAWIK